MATRKITVLDEGAPLLGAGLPPIRTKVGGPLPPSASRRASSGATNGTTRSTMGAFAAAVLLVTGAGGAAYRDGLLRQLDPNLMQGVCIRLSIAAVVTFPPSHSTNGPMVLT